MKNPFIKLAVGAVLLGVGFVVSMNAQRELIAKWGSPCEDCDEEENQVEPAKDEIEPAKEEEETE
ncbi:MAG: hypothetical protein ACYC56_13185 [Candidatus Aquicultor sp.]